jgi:hypothetical protein
MLGGKIVGPEGSAFRILRSAFPPARAISTKNKHLLAIFSDPNPRFHGGSFGV